MPIDRAARGRFAESSSSPSPSAVSAPTSSKSFSRAARSSRASENSPSSMPSPTYQWTKARLAYMRSNLWSMRESASPTAVVLATMHRALHLGEVAAGHDGGRLVVDAALEARRAPVDELDRALGLDRGDRGVDVLGDDVATVHEAARHVLAVARVALGHHAGRLEDRVRDLGDGELLVVRLLGEMTGAFEHEVDARVRHEVRLELRDVDVEGAVEAQRRRERRDHLGEEAVQVGVRRALDVEVAAADVVEGLVVEGDGHVRVLEERVRRSTSCRARRRR